MTTVTPEEVRVFCNMESGYPSGTTAVPGTLNQWIADVLAICDQFNPDAADAISNIIIKNRISKVYMATRNQGNTNGALQASSAMFTPLTTEEMTLLNPNATNVDAISMNGKRISETYGGRR